MKLARAFFVAHLAALLFGLGGLLIALPNPQLWGDDANARRVFDFGMDYGGSLHIIFGALAMLAFGIATIGARRTLIFFVVSVVLSLSSELIGTGTGWPFGNYEYTSFLGYKVLDRVPFTIPLSWFYVGFTCYLIANTFAARYTRRAWGLVAVLGGAYLLTVWDLVLDPAMAHDDLAVRFWTWSETGGYFGMPLKNFAGWTLTAAVFMAVSRVLWRRDIHPASYSLALPVGVYVANMVFASALSISVDLWIPVLLGIVLGVLPAVLVWRADDLDRSRTNRVGAAGAGGDPVSKRVMRTGAGAIARRLDLRVEGVEHVPPDGPVLIAARHYHHLYDGCAIVTAVRRPVHILVALDWAQSPAVRRVMETACRAAGWPVVVRPERVGRDADVAEHWRREQRRYLRRGVREAVDVLRGGEVLVVFPEGYPTIDIRESPKEGADAFLPFQAGFARLAEMAERDGRTRVPIVPLGLAYDGHDHRTVTMRFGSPVYLDTAGGSEQAVALVERQVRALSVAGAPVEALVAQKAV